MISEMPEKSPCRQACNGTVGFRKVLVAFPREVSYDVKKKLLFRPS